MRRGRFHLLLRGCRGRGLWRGSVVGRRVLVGGRWRGRIGSRCYCEGGWRFGKRGMGECRGGTLG